MTIISAKWEGGYVHGEANQPMNSNVDACNCDIQATKRTKIRAKQKTLLYQSSKKAGQRTAC